MLLRPSPLAHALLLAISLGGAVPATLAAETRSYHIASGSLEDALNQFGRESGALISFGSALTQGLLSPGLDGQYEVGQGLDACCAAAACKPARKPTTPSACNRYRRAIAARPWSWGPRPWSATGWPMRGRTTFSSTPAPVTWSAAAFERSGASSAREVLNRIPGVNAPENNGTGSHDLALNFGIRGLNPRLASRSTVLMDGIPVPFAPYGQPQLSLAPISLGNMDAVDVVRGGGAVRYGPQNVGGIVNFVTRAIPEEATFKAAMQNQISPSSSQDGEEQRQPADRRHQRQRPGRCPAVLRHRRQRLARTQRHADRRPDAQGQAAARRGQQPHAMAQYYEGEAEMPGG
jgi:Fe(3+) dicitrate transport protein